MLHRILSEIHKIPVFGFAMIIIALVAAWTVISFFFHRRPSWKRTNAVLLAAAVTGVVLITVVFRSSDVRELSLTPFISFEYAKIHPDVYAEVILNVILFMPIGFSLPNVICGRFRRPVLISAAFSFLLSLTAEALQYALAIGHSEVDDLIFNTLGAFIGTVPFIVVKRFGRTGED